MEYGLIGLLILIVDIYAIYHTLKSGASTGEKVAWTIGILLFPFLGALLWFFLGPKGGTRPSRAV